MPSCKAHRQSAVTPLDLLTEIALEWRASVCSWLIRWIERLELSNRGKALRQASEQHCWETQGIIYQGWHVWLILQHTCEVSPSPKNQIQALTQILREKGVKQGLIFGSRRRRRRRQQLILNLFLRSIEIWVTAQSEAISILCGAPPHPPSSPRQRFWLALHNGSRWRGWYLHSDTTKTRHSNAINQSINQSFYMFRGNYW